MEELNKKIAEWCGLKSPHIDDLGHAIYWKEGYEGWCPVPHFTRSLDACFKYIEPKLFGIDILKLNRYEQEFQTAYKARVRLPREKWFVATEKVAALALCLAVEKLIDGR